jgi:hypothetical protein
VSLNIPFPLGLYDLKGHFRYQIPVQTEIGLGVGMNGRRLIVLQEASRENPYSDDISFEIVRDRKTKFYIYAMACVPIIFSAILVHWFFRPDKKESVRSSIFEALASTLAVLPLRVVLVPAEISGLTRVDLILGFAIALTLALFVMRYACELSSLKRRPRVG